MRPFRPKDAERDRREAQAEEELERDLDSLEERREALDELEHFRIEAIATLDALRAKLDELWPHTSTLNEALQHEELEMERRLNPHMRKESDR